MKPPVCIWEIISYSVVEVIATAIEMNKRRGHDEGATRIRGGQVSDHDGSPGKSLWPGSMLD
jgi:hypothetical protein